MKKFIFLFFFGTLLMSCKQEINDSDLTKMNGYWEIEKVILKDGKKKDYKVNPTIDYFEIKDKKGFRQKVMPQFNGTFATNTIKEILVVSEKKGDFFIHYTTDYEKWKEEIIVIQDSILVFKNKDGIEYHYKKYLPFSLK